MLKYFILLLSFITLASCTNTKATPSSTIQPTNVQTNKTLYVDVREPSEWAAGHVDGAILVPLGQIEGGDYSQIPKDVPVRLYCHSGRRAGIALDILTKAGYTNVENVGGIESVAGVKIVR